MAKRKGRTPHGVRGLKSANQGKIISWLGRTPHGVRGLKFHPEGKRGLTGGVAPLTGCVD